MTAASQSTSRSQSKPAVQGAPSALTLSDREENLLRRFSRRFMWFLLLLAVFNALDRVNVGFAALTMNRDLGLSASTYGLAVAAFSIGYMLAEIPSNLILARVGARIWITRIAVSWGLVACACAFVTNATGLIILRALLGIAEAGFFPGVVLFLTYWFPQYYRARMQSYFMMAQPLSGTLSPLLAGAIMQLGGVWGIAGWRWLFFLEGLPAILLGGMTLIILADRPSKAQWLSNEEKALSDSLLERDVAGREDAQAQAMGQKSRWGRVRHRATFVYAVLLLGVTISTIVASFNALSYWLPQIVKEIVDPKASLTQVALLAAIPHACALCVMPYWSARSDKRKERRWHLVLPLLVAIGGWSLAALTHSHVLQMLGLVISASCTMAAWPVFYTLPSLILPRSAYALGIASVSTIGVTGGIYSPIVVGWMRDLTGSFTGGLAAVAGMMGVGLLALVLLPRKLFDAPQTAAY